MITINIPGYGNLKLKYLVSDFTGTLSIDGKLLPQLKEKLIEISKMLEIHILTADTFSKANEQLKDLPVKLVILKGDRIDKQKQIYIKKLGYENVFALGNGINDRFMLKKAKIGVAVCLEEGAAINTIKNADIFCKSPVDAIDLLINTKRLIATLRF